MASSAPQIFSNIMRTVSKATEVALQNDARAKNPDAIALRANPVAPEITRYAIGTIPKVSSMFNEQASRDYIRIRPEQSYWKKMADASLHIEQIFSVVIDSSTTNDKTSNNIDSVLQDLINAINHLKNAPRIQERKLVVQKLQEFIGKVKNIVNNLQKLRNDLDKEVESVSNHLNMLLERCSSYNRELVYQNGTEQDIVQASLANNIRETVENIAEHLSVKVQYDSHSGVVDLKTAAGHTLLEPVLTTGSKYTALSIEELMSGKTFAPFLLVARTAGGLYLDRYPLSEQDKSTGKMKSYVTSGRLGALFKLRDEIIPDIIQQLDQVMFNLAQDLNEEYNKASSNTGIPKLSGTAALELDTTIQVQGQVRIAMLDENGRSLANTMPMDLDLSKMDIGDGPGKVNPQAIITAINEYFDSSNVRAEVNGLRDIKLVAQSTNVAAGQPFNIGFELSNNKNEEVKFKAVSVSVVDGTGNQLSGAVLDNSSYTIPSAKQQWMATKAGIVINPTSPLSYPYKIELVVEVMQQDDSLPYRALLTYEIGDPRATGAQYGNSINGIFGHRYSATGVSTAIDNKNLGKTSFITSAGFPHGGISARLKNKDGQTIISTKHQGFLELYTSNPTKWHFTIDSLDSALSAESKNAGILTERGFSHFFGLNNLLLSSNKDYNTWYSKQGAASNIIVHPDIIKNPQLLATGILQKESDHNLDKATPIPGYSMENADTNGIRRWAMSLIQVQSTINTLVTERANNTRNTMYHANTKSNEFQSVEKAKRSAQCIDKELETQTFSEFIQMHNILSVMMQIMRAADNEFLSRIR